MMAKKSKGTGPGSGRGGKENANWTSDDLRKEADQLQELVDMLHHAADTMDKLGIERYRTVVGNWHKGVKSLQRFVPQYVLARLSGEASARGLDYKQFLDLEK
jgi:hypothetical protein